jgi:hypothetical protein
MLYADFHRPVKKAVLPFPKAFHGKEYEVVEKTDSVEIASVGIIPTDGVPLDVRGTGGSVVLRVLVPYRSTPAQKAQDFRRSRVEDWGE